VWADFEVVTFDCYGTLIDWEAGILSSLGRAVRAHRPEASDEVILEAYAAAESAAEAGAYVRYREVLKDVVRGVARAFGFDPSPSEISCLERSLPSWPPFADTAPALRALGGSLRLGVVSNVDNDLFALTAATLEVDFEWVITAEHVGSYKPSRRNFERALERIGLPPGRVLHAAQSLYHDIEPASAVGLTTVWVNRRAGRCGFGATPPSRATPDITVASLEELARLIGAA
jgi:2-haloacid dehalogenase